MPLSSGARLGPYEIQAAIGAGGMGEVYKARDTRLDRTVAIKILPAELSADPDRRVRFEREARAVAALSHPQICTLYDIGTHPSTGSGKATLYLVMEYLGGETLADRLLHGPLPLAQALDIGAQIAEALDAAHKHGIIHRDLKPGNVMLTTSGAGRSGMKSAKLLDFGLAKLAAHGERPALAGGASVPTRDAPVTAEGTILGTLQYMAPEQLEGKEADARTDLWALGAILYEMLTGKRAFEGDSQVSLIGNIMNAEPARLATVQPLTPPALDRVVQKCLAKHPDDRWDTAHDVADELRWTAEVSSAAGHAGASSRRRLRVPVGIGAAGVLAGVLIGAALTWVLRPAAVGVSLTRPSLDVGPAEELNSGGVSTKAIVTRGGTRTALAWTPDGRALVFVGRRAGVQQLYVRRLDEAEARPLRGTEDAEVPAVSADGKWVAFWAGGAIRKVPVGGGPAMDLASGVTDAPWRLVWDAGGRVYFDRYGRELREDDGRLWRIPAGGLPEAITERAEGETRHILPCPLPGGKAILYTVRKREWSWGDEEVVAQVLATGERKVLLKDAADPRYLPTGHILFMRRGTLFAVPFDAERIEVKGAAVPVLDGVVQGLTGSHSSDITGAGQFAVAPTGTMGWIPGPVAPFPERTLVTVDRRGQIAALPAPPRAYFPPVRVSPDGRRLAVTIAALADHGVWLFDVGRGTLSVLTGGADILFMAWAPDGRRLAFDWLKDGKPALVTQPDDGSAPPQVLVARAMLPSSWRRDGSEIAASIGNNIAIVDTGGGGAGERLLFESPDYEQSPVFSPDGRWLAYGSDVSGQSQIYVRPYPGPGAAEPVSPVGGASPAWHPNGREIFFVTNTDQPGTQRMMAASFAPGSPPAVGPARVLFQFDSTELFLDCEPLRCYDVSPDGQRFYATRALRALTPPPVTHVSLMTNFFEELKAKVPVKR